MTAATVDELVNAYLSRLEAAAADLPDGRRAELLAEIREHIEAARSEGVAADEATTRTMLDQLGEPEEIAAAARAELGEPPAEATPSAATAETRPGTGLELAAVLMLTIGSFIPLAGWAVGVVLLWASRRWTITERIMGTLVVPTGPGGVLFFGGIGRFAMPARECTGQATPGGGEIVETCSGPSVSPWVAIPLFLIALIAPFIIAGVLYSRARARAEAETPAPRPAGALGAQRTWTGTEITAVVLLGAGPILAWTLVVVLGTAILAPLALLAGLPFVWASSQWTQREKWAATAIAAAPVVVAFVFLLSTFGSLLMITAAALPIVVVSMLGPIAAAVYLALALNRRRRDGATRR